MGLAKSAIARKPSEAMRLAVTTFIGIVFGFLIGISFPTFSSVGRLNVTQTLHTPVNLAIKEENNLGILPPPPLPSSPPPPPPPQPPASPPSLSINPINDSKIANDTFQIWVPSNPRGAEMLPPNIVVAESDLYLRRLWGKPSEDLTKKAKYLVTFTVGYDQRNTIDACVKKFSENFTILLFHYDGRTTEWDRFEWSKRAIHISATKQTKWWYAKRFLHPDIVAPYDYIFIWDEDLAVAHFNAERYIELVKKYGLEISQPGLEPNRGLTWQMTRKRDDSEVHKTTEEKEGWCRDSHLPPCAAFVEIMAPVFSRDAWRCVWHMIQNDLVHGWGLDFALRICAHPGHEKIGVVDAQWVVHQTVPSLGSQGESQGGHEPWRGVRDRCKKEWAMFRTRLVNAEISYYKAKGIDPPNSTRLQGR